MERGVLIAGTGLHFLGGYCADGAWGLYRATHCGFSAFKRQSSVDMETDKRFKRLLTWPAVLAPANSEYSLIFTAMTEKLKTIQLVMGSLCYTP